MISLITSSECLRPDIKGRLMTNQNPERNLQASDFQAPNFCLDRHLRNQSRVVLLFHLRPKATSNAQINLKPIQSAKLVIMTLTKIKAAVWQKNWDSPAATDGGYWPAVRREEQTKVSFRPRIPQLFSGGSKKFPSVDGWRVDWQKNPGNLPALGEDLSRLLTGRKG